MSTTTTGRVLDKSLGARLRIWLPWLLLLAITVALTMWATAPRSSLPLDPENPGPNGAKALAQVLKSRGVKVQPVRSSTELTKLQPTEPTTLLLVSNGKLSKANTEAVSAVAGRYANLVLVGVDSVYASVAGITARRSYQLRPTLENNCQDPMLGQVKQVSGAVAGNISSDTTVQGCFGDSQGWLLLSKPATQAKPRIDLLVSPETIKNSQITRQDDALLALRLLSRNPKLVWFSPEHVNSAAVTPTGPSRFPAWYNPMLALGAVVIVATMLWRGSRFGRLVTEPLPVKIRASETIRSRGRLYGTAPDRNLSLAKLQAGTRRRLASRLSVPPGAPATVLVNAVAGVSGWSTQQVSDLLFNSADQGDSALVARANALIQLEEKCR